MRICPIVEGEGEVESVPILLRRLAAREEVFDLTVVRPIRVKRSKVVKVGELENAVELAARNAGEGGAVLVLLDADDDPVCTLGPALAERARRARAKFPSSVVLAKFEFEAWFIAAIRSLRGHGGIPASAELPGDAEAIRGAKEWINRLMAASYSPSADQPRLTATFDLEQARGGSPSFDKLCREVARLLGK